MQVLVWRDEQGEEMEVFESEKKREGKTEKEKKTDRERAR